MGVAVLKPEDCLKVTNPMKRLNNSSHNPNRTNRKQPNRGKPSSNTSPPRPAVGPKALVKNLVMGQVKILKRGEDLKQSKPLVNVDKENVGPNPVSIPSQIRLAESKSNENKVVSAPFYAGSAFTTSPSPSSVPLPAFFTKKIGPALKDEVATSELMRILKLDL